MKIYGIFYGFFILALIACAYFILRLIIGIIIKEDKKYHIKRLVTAFAVVMVTFIGFLITYSPEESAKTQTNSEIKQKEIQKKIKADDETKQSKSETSTFSSKKFKVRKLVKEYTDAQHGISIDSVTVNPHLGTEKDGDYIALVNLTWNVNNSGKTSKKMLDMYSSDIAVTMYNNLPEIQEVVVFWTVPYLNNGSAKISFERANGGMVYTDKVFDRNFNQ